MTIESDFQMPAAIDAERALLGALMLESSLWSQAGQVTPDDFSC